ncbi:hypothetical protein K6X14_00650 [Xanthomonas euvesicatoria pv. allii]|nr:hypothetical protein [Xanthomonas campestris pv. heliotropii]MCP3041659.1 hypothetical protein [Xanthomonas euvesicatoria pv. allii]
MPQTTGQIEAEINAVIEHWRRGAGLRERSPMRCTAIALMRPTLLADLLGRRCDSRRV